jgi:hypothetical protein
MKGERRREEDHHTRQKTKRETYDEAREDKRRGQKDGGERREVEVGGSIRTRLYTSEAKFKVRLLMKPKGAYSEEHSRETRSQSIRSIQLW